MKKKKIIKKGGRTIVLNGDAEYIENCGTIIINEKEETTIIVKGENKNEK